MMVDTVTLARSPLGSTRGRFVTITFCAGIADSQSRRAALDTAFSDHAPPAPSARVSREGREEVRGSRQVFPRDRCRVYSKLSRLAPVIRMPGQDRDRAVKLLEHLGHTAVVVENGKEAVAAAQKGPFDLVFMDVQMPEMDGLEATATIRAQETTGGPHIPIVAMTAHAMIGDREQCLKAGMDGYLSKPISAQQLSKAIDEALACKPLKLPL